MSSKILPNENEGVQGKFASVFFCATGGGLR